MGFFRIQWLHRLIRKRTKPIPEDTALVWKKRLTFGYVFLAWNTLGFIGYNVYKGNVDIKSNTDPMSKLSPGQQWALTLGKPNADVYRISGFSLKKLENKNNSDTVEQSEDSEVEN